MSRRHPDSKQADKMLSLVKVPRVGVGIGSMGGGGGAKGSPGKMKMKTNAWSMELGHRFRAIVLMVLALATFAAFAMLVLLQMSAYVPQRFPSTVLTTRMDAMDKIRRASEWFLLVVVPFTSALTVATPRTRGKSFTDDRTILAYGWVAWILYAAFLVGWVRCLDSTQCWWAFDCHTTLGVLAFLAEILMISATLVRDHPNSFTPKARESATKTLTKTNSPKKKTSSTRLERLPMMLNNFTNMLLVVGALILTIGLEVELPGERDSLQSISMGAFSWTAALGSLALVVTAVFSTYGLRGVLVPTEGWHFFQPFTGGITYIIFQAVSWTCFAAGILIEGLYLISILVVEFELFVGAMTVAGSLFFVAEVIMMMSLLVYKAKTAREHETMQTKPSTFATYLARVNDFADKWHGILIVAGYTNVHWIPSALCLVLFAVTTHLSFLDSTVYMLASTMAEFVFVLSSSIATHFYNQDSNYGENKNVSSYRPKYVIPRVATGVLPAISLYVHVQRRLEATLPVAILTVYFYIYAFTYRGRPEHTGCRWRKDWILPGVNSIVKYFKVHIIRDAPLDPRQHYIMAFHPHGIMSLSAVWLQSTSQWRSLFPDIHAHVLTASVVHQVPLLRDILEIGGAREVSRQSFAHTLEEHESVMLVSGGQSEMLRQCSGKHQVRVVSHHVGFLRLAIRYGVPVVPVLSFQEAEVLDNISAPGMQHWFIKRLAYPFPYFPYGRAMLPIPRSLPMTFAIGSPLPVKKIEAPTAADIEKVRHQYFQHLQQLFDKYKEEAGCKDAQLVLIDK